MAEILSLLEQWNSIFNALKAQLHQLLTMMKET